MAMDIYGNVIMPEPDPGFYGPRPQARGGYGFAPYEEAAARSRLTWQQRLGAALGGLGAVRPGAGFGEAFLQSLGGSSRNVMAAQAAAQQAAQEYAQRQIESERQRERDELYRKVVEADIESKTRQKPVRTKLDEITEAEAALGRPLTVMEKQTIYGIAPKEAKEPKTEPLVVIEGPDGKPVYVRQSQAVGKRAPSGTAADKPLTEGQANAAAYFDRAQAAEDAIASFEDKYTRMGLGQLQQRYLPNAMQTPEQQAFNQAQREFVTAKLRRESGAAISQSEFENEAKTLFAQPGDSQKVLSQKRAARRRVIEGLRRSSGSALTGSRTGSFNPVAARAKYGY